MPGLDRVTSPLSRQISISCFLETFKWIEQRYPHSTLVSLSLSHIRLPDAARPGYKSIWAGERRTQRVINGPHYNCHTQATPDTGHCTLLTSAEAEQVKWVQLAQYVLQHDFFLLQQVGWTLKHLENNQLVVWQKIITRYPPPIIIVFSIMDWQKWTGYSLLQWMLMSVLIRLHNRPDASAIVWYGDNKATWTALSRRHLLISVVSGGWALGCRELLGLAGESPGLGDVGSLSPRWRHGHWLSTLSSTQIKTRITDASNTNTYKSKIIYILQL